MSVNAPAEGSTPVSPLLEALQTLRERWWIVVLTMIVGAVISFGVAATSAKQYQAQSSLLIRSSNLQTLIDSNASQNAEDPARLAATNLLLVTSTAVGELVKQSLRTTESVCDLVAQIDASLNPDADIINITATDGDPERAARLANAFADQFVAFERNQAQQQAAAGATRLRSELASLPAAATAQRAQLLTALHNVLALEAVTTGDATRHRSRDRAHERLVPDPQEVGRPGRARRPRHRSCRGLPDRPVRPPAQDHRGVRGRIRPARNRQHPAGPADSERVHPGGARVVPDPTQRTRVTSRTTQTCRMCSSRVRSRARARRALRPALHTPPRSPVIGWCLSKRTSDDLRCTSISPWRPTIAA